METIVILFLVYFTPSIACLILNIKNFPTVLVFNIFFAWTIIGWFFSLHLITLKIDYDRNF